MTSAKVWRKCKRFKKDNSVSFETKTETNMPIKWNFYTERKSKNIAQKSPHGYALISGEYDDERKTVILYHYTREAPAYNKESLRHECIHFILDAAGLPNGDEEPLFLVLAMEYHARPYMILKEGVLERIRETAEGFGLDLGI